MDVIKIPSSNSTAYLFHHHKSILHFNQELKISGNIFLASNKFLLSQDSDLFYISVRNWEVRYVICAGKGFNIFSCVYLYISNLGIGRFTLLLPAA